MLRATSDSTTGQIRLLKSNNGSDSKVIVQGQAEYDQVYTPAFDTALVCRGHMETRLGTRVATGSSLSSLGAPTTNFDFATNRLTGLGNPVNAQDAATRQWVLDQLSALGVSSYPSSYTIRINIGDIPSSIESLASTGDQTYP